MSANGFWGLRYNKIDKIMLINESNPDIIGEKISKFCKIHKYQREVENLYNRITLLDPYQEIMQEDEDIVKKIKNIIPEAKGKFWGDLLYKTRDDFFLYADGLKYMANYGYLTKNSFYVEYGYIINIDSMKLEIWKGKQTIPQKGNRYGIKKKNGFYPCRMICTYRWNKITDGLKDYRDIELVYKELQEMSRI